ncbi:MAG: hypothetical protein KVP17_001310 [Porospora cf. gigantea B]|uniref:uncharacterized protein n=1 Tax=Porospora cf. gigantea B TaxID=2853592 RepID=UPI003571AF0A|nr:MAG: hypothetical protein KVP17_001310 [Porospora cf. gigantea B]
MREMWAYRCDVHWPCQGAAVVSYIEGNSLPGLYHQVVSGPPPPFHKWETPATHTEPVPGTGSRTPTSHIGATPHWTILGPVLESWTSLACTATKPKCIKWRLYAMCGLGRASPLVDRPRSVACQASYGWGCVRTTGSPVTKVGSRGQGHPGFCIRPPVGSDRCGALFDSAGYTLELRGIFTAICQQGERIKKTNAHYLTGSSDDALTWWQSGADGPVVWDRRQPHTVVGGVVGARRNYTEFSAVPRVQGAKEREHVYRKYATDGVIYDEGLAKARRQILEIAGQGLTQFRDMQVARGFQRSKGILHHEFPRLSSARLDALIDTETDGLPRFRQTSSHSLKAVLGFQQIGNLVEGPTMCEQDFDKPCPVGWSPVMDPGSLEVTLCMSEVE